MRGFQAIFVAPLCLLVLHLSACGDDPLFTSDQISVRIGLKEGDILGNQVEGRKNVSTESGNPYAHFLSEVNRTFGDQPVEIRVEAVSIQITETKDDVAAFEDLWSGLVEVFLAPDDTAAGYAIGSVNRPTGVGPVSLTLTEQASALGGFQNNLLSGSFRVGLRGETTLTERDAKFDTKISVTLTFGAYER